MERRKFVVGLGALAAGGSAAMGTGAFTAAEIDGRDANIQVVDDTDAILALEAGDSEFVTDEGGEYDNELEIDFSSEGGDGVNPNSTYQVGGLGGVDNLDEIPGSPGAAPAAETLAIDTDSEIDNYYAFKLTNQSGDAHNVEITYDAEDADGFPDGARVLMVSYAPEVDGGTSEEVSALVAQAQDEERRASILYSDDANWSNPLGSGDVVYVTLLVRVEDAETDADLGGEIVVRAGSHDEFIDPDPPE